jgi:hypothetical protein
LHPSARVKGTVQAGPKPKRRGSTSKDRSTTPGIPLHEAGVCPKQPLPAPRRPGDRHIREKSDPSFAILAAAATDRLKFYAEPSNEDLAECYRQLSHIQYDLKANETMSWQAAHSGHDDFMASACLAVKAATETSPPAAGGMVRAQPTVDDLSEW